MSLPMRKVKFMSSDRMGPSTWAKPCSSAEFVEFPLRWQIEIALQVLSQGHHGLSTHWIQSIKWKLKIGLNQIHPRSNGHRSETQTLYIDFFPRHVNDILPAGQK